MMHFWLNRDTIPYSLNTLYKSLGATKQAFHQRLDRQFRLRDYEHQLLFLIYELRAEHPTMGCRDMYYLLKPECMGRDAFEWFCKAHGLGSEKKINYSRTTNSTGVYRFENLTVGLVVDRLNQLWVSDITYFFTMDQFYYLTFILDAFSRRILGYSVSKRLFTENTTLAAFRKAISQRDGFDLAGTIIHSDGGGQYYDHNFLQETQQHKMVNSMCLYPWENGKAERVNGIIKNNYLKHRDIKSFEELQVEVDRAVKLYNEKKPHKALNRVTPVNFENNYIYAGKTSEGDESTTDHAIRPRMGTDCLCEVGKTSFGSDITLDYASKSTVNN